MRTIKFRYRIYHQYKGINEIRTHIYELEEIEAGAADINFGIQEILSRDEFTGLTDKNGKEIYEGDILKEYFGGLWLIVWNEDYLHWAFKTVQEPPKDGNNIDTSDMKSPKRLLERSEVVGNIYENPDLRSVSDSESDATN